MIHLQELISREANTSNAENREQVPNEIKERECILLFKTFDDRDVVRRLQYTYQIIFDCRLHREEYQKQAYISILVFDLSVTWDQFKLYMS